MAEAFITPELVEWARKRHNLTVGDLAHKINVKADLVESWEKGQLRPTFRQAQKIAQKLYIPFGYLFLSSPPSLELPLPDLRTVSRETRKPPSPEFYDLLSDVLAKQEWYREYLEDEEAESISFIGKFSLNESADDIARDIRATLGINDRMRLTARNWEQFLTEFIRKAEDVGILVMRSGVVGSNNHRPLDVDEFRGFVISDDVAPLIFINIQDAKSAQIFTLAHELAHLWVGESGVSNPNYREKSSNQSNSVEQLCNRVAAEVLLPKIEFAMSWLDNLPIDRNLREVSRRYRVSNITVLRQAYDQGRIDSDTYWRQYQLEVAKFKKRKGNSDGDFYNTLTSRNSTTLTLALIGATLEGHMTQREAANLLNVRIKTLDSVVERFFGGHD